MSECKIVKSSALGKEFWYCRTHDDEADMVRMDTVSPTWCRVAVKSKDNAGNQIQALQQAINATSLDLSISSPHRLQPGQMAAPKSVESPAGYWSRVFNDELAKQYHSHIVHKAKEILVNELEYILITCIFGPYYYSYCKLYKIVSDKGSPYCVPMGGALIV